MKILIVSWFFPPANTIGAVRLGKAAQFLIDQGHDVRVLAGKDLPYPQTLAVELPLERIWYAKWADLNALPSVVKAAVLRGRVKTAAAANADANVRPVGTALNLVSAPVARRLRGFYTNLTNIPDNRVGWFPYAMRAGRNLLKSWRPDLVFASGPPFTTLLIGSCLSRKYGLPLVVEFRDRWSDDPYYPPPRWRGWIDRFVERRVVAQASGITTVSPPWAATYREFYHKPVAVVFNGYDSDLCPATPSLGSDGRSLLRIVYTGGIYPGRRDPSALFQAVRLLGSDSRKVRIEFFGTNPNLVRPLAHRYGVADQVVVHPEVSHKEAVRQQRNADVLLLMQWNDPREQGNVPGKFFEYLGALRPILVLGLGEGVPATILRDRQAGFMSNDPVQIATQLAEWIRTKEVKGHIAPLPTSTRRSFSREEQFEELERFLIRIVDSAGIPIALAGNGHPGARLEQRQRSAESMPESLFRKLGADE